MPVQQPLRRKKEQVHHRPRHPDGGKGGLPGEAADDHGVYGVVQLLEDVPKKSGGRASDTSWGGMEPRVRAAVSTACHLTVSSGETRDSTGRNSCKIIVFSL